ncbi:ATP-dependent Clp protease proteolytic subunit [Flavobacterium salilacus]|nr:ATP-dependent Clp protease proteolytic subunit [Flavobacterium salilacus]
MSYSNDLKYKKASQKGGFFIEKLSERDYWMTAEEAKAFGMIDEVL